MASINQKIYCPKIRSHPPGKVSGNPVMVNSDNSITRLGPFPLVPPTPDLTSSTQVFTKDLTINPHHNTSVRLFLPRTALAAAGSTCSLPLLVFFHAGGFLIYNAASPVFHSFCTKMAASVGAVVASVDYRLAPENRLPAAYDDGVEALHMIAKSKDEWVKKFVDLSSCYLVGFSAGANIVYHVAGRVATDDPSHFEPPTIRGLVLLHSTFGGKERSASELIYANDRVVPLIAIDLVWELSLPIGADADHEYSNQIINGRASAWAKLVAKHKWNITFIGCHEDTFSDRQKQLAMVLKEEGLKVVVKFEKGYHNIELYDKKKAQELFDYLKSLVHPLQQYSAITKASRL